MCIVLLADLLDASERRRLLLNEDGELRDEVAFDTHEMAFARHHVRSIAAMLTMEGEEPCIQYRRGGASHDVTRAAILRCEKTSPVERVYLLTDAGDDDGARRLLQASSGLASISSWEQSYSSAAAFLRDIEVAAAPGDAQECNRAIEAGARGGPHQNFFRLIQKGDSEGVVRLVRENDSYLPDSFLVSCGGRLGPIGDALRGWNDAAAYHPCPYCGFDPALSALRRRRWNAYRLRASSQAEKLSKIVRRFVPVVLDREIAVPFEMLGAYGKDAETWVWERRPASGEP
jgi:hypothetical protein